MTKKPDTIDHATSVYIRYTGATPGSIEIENLYHAYRNQWKAFSGFEEYLQYVWEFKE